jgi:hypothetical protein
LLLKIEYAIEDITIIIERNANLSENQLEIPSFVKLTLLFNYNFFIWAARNYYYRPYARIVEMPLIVEVKPVTIGEAVILHSLVHYLWLFK